MNCKFIIGFFFIILINFTFAQSKTYFIKYKNHVDKSVIEEKIKTNKLSNSLNKTILPETISINHFAKNLGKDDENLSRIIKVDFKDEQSAAIYLNELKSDNSIEYIQPAITYRVETMPNDSLVQDQWALQKINAFDAWNITKGSDTILVSIIDTGIDYLHPDLKNKIFINEGETGIDINGNDKRTNGIDDDGNGFIDDFMGWDFVDRSGFPTDTTQGDYVYWDNNPMDEMWHGTAVAGIVGAETNNNMGIAGVAPDVKLLNVRSFDRNGFGDEDDAAAAILYSVMIGAKIINMSWGDYSFSYVLRDVIKYAHSQNVILIASAGNQNSSDPHYPSGYTEVISVGNTDPEDRLTGGSNYGSTIDLSAPGLAILSTRPGNIYEFQSGTSFSAPHVSGTAALILSLRNFTNEEVKQILKSTADDIGQTGWDMRTGAGRLNMYKALSILSPAKIGFDYPHQDFATADDTLNIFATVMSPYFVSYDLMYGEGVNPEKWNTLISGMKFQTLNEKIFTLQTSTLNEGEYTLRLILYLNNGSTTEERVNFHIQRTPPQIELAGTGPVYYGSRSTIMGEVYTSTLAVTRMYYRQKGSAEFNFISLDGFTTNNQFVKQLHWGIIPKQLAQPNTVYEIYFEAENLVGLKSILKDDNGSYFEFKTAPLNDQAAANELPFTLPKGSLFGTPVNFISNQFNEILFDPIIPDSGDEDASVKYALYKLNGNSFEKIVTIKDKFPKTVGDFNHNNKTDLLSHFSSTGYIDEYESNSDSLFKNKVTDPDFFPILASDIDGDGSYEAISNNSARELILWKINSDLSITPLDTIKNFTSDSAEADLEYYNDVYRNTIITDADGDGKNEIWTVDADGDLFSYEYINNQLSRKYSLQTNFTTNQKEIITSGDFDGDGTKDIAVLFNSNSIAHYYFILVFNFKNQKPNILYENVFLDQSAEYTGLNFDKFYQTLGFADVDNDGNDELVLNTYPYAYIVKYNSSGSKIIYYAEEVNTEFIFKGDLNQNGVTEIGLQFGSGYKFFEFASSKQPDIPSDLNGYSVDSTTIKLSWNGSAHKYYIYRGLEKENLSIIDSTASLNYFDNSVQLNTNYYFAVQAFDPVKEIPYSALSNSVLVYSHKPGTAVSASAKSTQSVLIEFSERINNTILSLTSFEVEGFGIPNSASAASQFSYLLSFNKELPAGENQLIVRNLKDYFGSDIKTDTLLFFVNPVIAEREFFISSHEIINPFRIRITFNLDVDENSITNLSNYVFEPDNKVVSAAVDASDKKTIYLNLAKEKPVGSIGKEYRLKIENLFSSTGIKLNSSAGSYIVLTGFAENLADVYVYPSPLKFVNGNEKLMFANLPQKAKITILTLEGEQLITLEEKDGNGGVEFDLRDETGNVLNSGIYLFRIVRLDNNNNEVEEKLGKFAVIR